MWALQGKLASAAISGGTPVTECPVRRERPNQFICHFESTGKIVDPLKCVIGKRQDF
jgi:hypothetical protein